VFLFGYRPRSIVGSGYSRSISAGGSWRPYLLVFRVWLIRSLTPPKTELPATIANRRPKVEKYRGNLFCFPRKIVELPIHFCLVYITDDITVASNAAKIALLVASVVLNRIARTENSMLHFNLIKVSITLSLMLNLLRRLEIEQQICIPFRFWRYKYSQFLAMCLLSLST
jgi:hypothetical protein